MLKFKVGYVSIKTRYTPHPNDFTSCRTLHRHAVVLQIACVDTTAASGSLSTVYQYMGNIPYLTVGKT